ncbi:MAG: hypothetical protein ACREFP_04085 [Acetobacteraceae bacterium]
MAFFKAPLNQGALAAMAGTWLGVLQGSLTWEAAVPVTVGAIIAMIIPDNSVAKEDIEKLVADAIKAGQDLERTKQNA